MARIHGNRGDIQIDPTGGAVGVSVASVDSWDLDLAKDRVDVTCFGDTNKQTVLGLPSYSGNLTGCWDSATTPTEIFDVVFGTATPFLTLIPDRVEPTFLFKGLANLDASLKVSAKGAVTWAGKFDAAGPWVMEPAGALQVRGNRDRSA